MCTSSFTEHSLCARIQTLTMCQDTNCLKIAWRMKQTILSPFYKENWALERVICVSKITQLVAPGRCLDSLFHQLPLIKRGNQVLWNGAAWMPAFSHSPEQECFMSNLKLFARLCVNPSVGRGIQISKRSVIPTSLRTRAPGRAVSFSIPLCGAGAHWVGSIGAKPDVLASSLSFGTNFLRTLGQGSSPYGPQMSVLFSPGLDCL